MLKKVLHNKIVVATVVAVLVVLVGSLIWSSLSGTDGDKKDQSVNGECVKDTEESTDEDVPYDPNGMEVVEDEGAESSDSVDAPASWEDNTDEKPSQDNVTDSSDISESTEKNDGNQSNDNDTSEPNDDEDGLPDEEDNSNTNWGTVF